MEGNPGRISVIIPHYNMVSRLPNAINSVLIQNHNDIEIIVVDDGSKHKVYSAEWSPPNSVALKFRKIPHRGKSAAVNYGFRLATGKYIVILDADDELPVNSLEKRLRSLQRHNADLCIGSFVIYYHGVMTEHRKLRNHQKKKLINLLLRCVKSPIHQNSMMFSRKLVQNAGYMNPDMKRGQDKDFAIRLLQHSRKTICIEDSVYLYNRYYRPLPIRLKNRWQGMRSKLQMVVQYTQGWRLIIYYIWGLVTESVKLCYFICRSR
jgi:glycosyltransferase involved in cell wall biosynthesis